MINTDFIDDILKFKGFMSAKFTDKLKWLFVLFPFFGIIFLIAKVEDLFESR